MVALTFDADAWRGQTLEVLHILHSYHVHATFFLTGEWIRNNPDLAQAIVADGDQIANHSNTHPHFPNLSNAQINRQLALADQTISSFTGESSRPFMRLPYGDGEDSSRVLGAIGDSGYVSVYWTLDSEDTLSPAKSRNYVYNLFTGVRNPNGYIFLQHPNSSGSVAALPDIIDNFQSRGLRIVTVRELLAPIMY